MWRVRYGQGCGFTFIDLLVVVALIVISSAQTRVADLCAGDTTTPCSAATTCIAAWTMIRAAGALLTDLHEVAEARPVLRSKLAD